MRRDHQTDYDLVRALAPAAARAEIRSGRYRGHTAGLASGRLQTNLVILPAPYADNFHRFCLANPKPCPLVGMSENGEPMLLSLGDIDTRTDVPAYHVYRDGVFAERVTEIGSLWQADFATFALGCSFTFERALIDEGIPLRHIDENKTVPMFRTNIETVASGPFGGGMVVSMRPVQRRRVEDAVTITSAFPHAHGAPMHHGDPAVIGISDVSTPDWGDAVAVADDEVPVFWACGVTPQNALALAKPGICITHAPGSMLITDVDEAAAFAITT
jgi:uncharacterized protein YcsI (UPF0317 family)